MDGLKLYDYAASANCYKVRLLLCQLGQGYERIPIDIFAGQTLSDEFGAINPQRTTPVLELADGRRLVESNAILLYLGLGTEFLPSEAFEQGQVARWLIFEQTDVVPMIGGLRFRLATKRLRPGDADAQRRLSGAREVLGLLDAHLAGSRFLVADRYSVADIAVFAYSRLAGAVGIEMEPYANFAEWLRRVETQPLFLDDLEPYPPNALPGAGRSLYDGE